MTLSQKECDEGLKTGIAALLLALLCWLLSGCTPAMQTSMAVTVNTAADIIDARILVWRDHVRAEARKQARFCNDEDKQCVLSAIRGALEKYEGERAQLDIAATVQHTMVEAITQLRECERVTDRVCVAETTGRLVRMAPELKHLLDDIQTARVK